MPRYFFDLRYGQGLGELATDPEGEVLKNDDEAQELARCVARRMLAAVHPQLLAKWLGCSFEVRSEYGQDVLIVAFRTVQSPQLKILH